MKKNLAILSLSKHNKKKIDFTLILSFFFPPFDDKQRDMEDKILK